MIRLRVFLHRNPEFDNSAALLFVDGKKVQLRQLIRALRLRESPFSHVVILSVTQENGRHCTSTQLPFHAVRFGGSCDLLLRHSAGEQLPPEPNACGLRQNSRLPARIVFARSENVEMTRVQKNPKITFQSRPGIPAAPSPVRSRGPWGLEHRR